MNREFGIAPYSFTSIIFMADGFFDGILRPSRELAPVPFACTLCGSCAFFCITVPLHAIWDSPAELVEGIRSLFIEEGALPTKVTEVLDNLASYGNPWRLPQSMKVKWEDECTVPVRDFTKEKCEYLLFMGDAAFIEETKPVLKSISELLSIACVNYGTLKEKEKDSGNTARELGEYGLFEELVRKNIKMFTEYDVKKIIAISPHDYHAFKTYYPKLGYRFDEVLHYTQILEKLIKESKIKPSEGIDKLITYHDSCILGRYYGIYETPREIIKSIPEAKFVEMRENRLFSLCCGGGGGRIWYDVPEEKYRTRIPDVRITQAKEIGAKIIVTACPYCKTMLLSAENLGEIAIKDVSELVLESVLP